MIKLFFSFFFLLTSLFSTEIVFNNIKEYKINKKNVLYTIESDIKKIDLKKLKRFKFFNKEQVASKASFYENGVFQNKDMTLNFKKAYYLEGNFIMKNIRGDINKYKIEAKKATYTRKSIILERVFIYINNRRMRKIKFTIPL